MCANIKFENRHNNVRTYHIIHNHHAADVCNSWQRRKRFPLAYPQAIAAQVQLLAAVEVFDVADTATDDNAVFLQTCLHASVFVRKIADNLACNSIESTSMFAEMRYCCSGRVLLHDPNAQCAVAARRVCCCCAKKSRAHRCDWVSRQ